MRADITDDHVIAMHVEELWSQIDNVIYSEPYFMPGQRLETIYTLREDPTPMLVEGLRS